MNSKAAELVRQLLATLRPAEDLQLADWVTKNLTLPEGQSVRPGPMENWPYFVEILNAMGDRGVERVTVMKSARVGYTTALMGVLAATAAMDPCPIILLMPTDDDARGISVDSVEPIFRANKVLRGLMRFGRLDGRNTIVRKSLAGGGTLKILSARAPRNLSRHDCRLLLCDEVDRYEVTSEGDALDLAERRTMAQPNRKIIIGSTPTDEDTSVVAARYEEGSQEIFEIPCIECGAYNAPEWSNLEWENHDPDYESSVLQDQRACEFVAEGVVGHARCGILRGQARRPVCFYNTVLGKPWRTTINHVDAYRTEPWART